MSHFHITGARFEIYSWNISYHFLQSYFLCKLVLVNVRILNLITPPKLRRRLSAPEKVASFDKSACGFWLLKLPRGKVARSSWHHGTTSPSSTDVPAPPQSWLLVWGVSLTFPTGAPLSYCVFAGSKSYRDSAVNTSDDYGTCLPRWPRPSFICYVILG